VEGCQPSNIVSEVWRWQIEDGQMLSTEGRKYSRQTRRDKHKVVGMRKERARRNETKYAASNHGGLVHFMMANAKGKTAVIIKVSTFANSPGVKILSV
jgi:hypothetical protein